MLPPGHCRVLSHAFAPRCGDIPAFRELFRRYSQFYDLMTTLCSNHKEVKKLQFPPKVTFGNLAASVVGNRREALGAWLNALLQMPEVAKSPEFLAFMEAREGVVTAGSKVPNLSFTNLLGSTVNTADYTKTHLILVAVASRFNFQKMTQWMSPAMEELWAKHRGLKMLSVSVADLRPVPAAMRGMVTKAMKKVDKKNSKALLGHLSQAGRFSAAANEVCVDWSGDTLRTMGAEDANWTYRVSLVANGVVEASFQSSTNNVKAKFVAAMDRIVAANPHFVLPQGLETSPSFAGTPTRDISISSSGKEVTEVEVAAVPAWLGWEVQATKNTTSVDIAAAADGAKLITPVEVPSGVHAKRLQLVTKPGKYVVTLKSPATLKGSQATFRAFATPLAS